MHVSIADAVLCPAADSNCQSATCAFALSLVLGSIGGLAPFNICWSAAVVGSRAAASGCTVCDWPRCARCSEDEALAASDNGDAAPDNANDDRRVGFASDVDSDVNKDEYDNDGDDDVGDK